MFEKIEGHWLLACSGGADSMALLALCVQKNMHITVVTVNYHKRDSALFDQEIVLNFCKNHDIEVIVLDGSKLPLGNFQHQARLFRYRSFADIARQKNALGVLVAHHADDVLETYFWQNQRNHQVQYYGIAYQSKVEGVLVRRPLLHVFKQDLLDFCIKNRVRFGVDESNFDITYTRNRIRKQMDSLDIEAKKSYLKEIEHKNQQLEIMNDFIESILSEWGSKIPIDRLEGLDLNIQLRAFQRWLEVHHVKKRFSKKQYFELLRQCVSATNRELVLDHHHLLWVYQRSISIISTLNYEYEFTFDKIEFVQLPWFAISTHGNTKEAVTIQKEDFPIVIRNWRPGDTIKLTYGHKKVQRWFIDQKIPVHQRRSWPIVVNQFNQVILVPQIGCDENHYSNNPTMFVLKL